MIFVKQKLEVKQFTDAGEECPQKTRKLTTSNQNVEILVYAERTWIELHLPSHVLEECDEVLRNLKLATCECLRRGVSHMEIVIQHTKV